MQRRVLTLVLTSRRLSVAAVALLVGLISLAMFAIPVNAEETTDEETTGTSEKEGAAAKSGDAAERAKDQNTEAVAGKNDSVVKAQSSQSLTVTQQQSSDERETAKQTVAQDSTQISDRARGLLAGMMVEVDDTGNSAKKVNRIGPITVSNCEELEVDPDAVVVLSGDDDGNTAVRIPNSKNNIFVTKDTDQLRITGPSGGDLVGLNIPRLNEKSSYEIFRSSGITCRRGVAADADDGNTGNANNLEDLECNELLRRFRTEGKGQYGDSLDQFADVDVRNQVIVCLEQEVIQDTAADEKLPDTGGLSLLALAALGLVSAVAGVSVVRGARREE